MKYFFLLGTNQTLSIAELSAIFPREIKNAELLLNEILIIDIDDINSSDLIKKIGGTIKIGIIKNEINFGDIVPESIKLIDDIKKEGKFKYGISYYGNKKFNTLKTGLEIKKHLKKQGISCRFVTSKEKTLSSVVVEQNNLITRGAEIVLIENENKILIGQTMAVQPFKELSFRDYGRPARDDQSGMIPPKLAQIMINLSNLTPQSPLLIRRGEGNASERGEVLLDPFCGSGTILTEAMMMDYNNIIGSDLSKKAIEDSQKNINWIIKKFELQNINHQIFNISATELYKEIKPNSIDAIITEPYLGPQRGKHDIKKTIKELETLYSQAIKEFKKALKDNGRVVMIWPVFRNKKYFDQITPNTKGFKIINLLPNNFQNNNLTLSKRNTIIYGRSDQKVWREILVLKKQ